MSDFEEIMSRVASALTTVLQSRDPRVVEMNRKFALDALRGLTLNDLGGDTSEEFMKYWSALYSLSAAVMSDYESVRKSALSRVEELISED